jgi:protein-S-isoprenylcysteine O-methyltransferase Ste14
MNDPNDAAQVKVFPPAVPLATVLLGVAAQYVIPLNVALALPLAARLSIGTIIVVGSVLGLGLWSVLLVRRSGQSENPWKPTTEIVDAGPFRVSRNPMYLQMVLVCVGFSVILWNVYIFVLAPLCAWTLQRLVILPEEVYLERKFGDVYREYKRRVRRWV